LLQKISNNSCSKNGRRSFKKMKKNKGETKSGEESTTKKIDKN